MPDKTPPPSYLTVLGPPPIADSNEPVTEPIRRPTTSDRERILCKIAVLEAQIQGLADLLCAYPGKVPPHTIGGDIAILIFRVHRIRHTVESWGR